MHHGRQEELKGEGSSAQVRFLEEGVEHQGWGQDPEELSKQRAFSPPDPITCSRSFPMSDKKNAPVRDLPEKKLPAGKADQIKGGRKTLN